jgi:hypothetical protein
MKSILGKDEVTLHLQAASAHSARNSAHAARTRLCPGRLSQLAVNSVSESWTGIGVVACFCATVLMMQSPHAKHVDTHRRITLLQILQAVRSIRKTRNQLNNSSR